MEPTIGFRIKVVEWTGRTIQSLVPSLGWSSLWEEGCYTTCQQGAEVIPNCTQQSVLYENICNICIPGTMGKGQKRLVVQSIETSRSIAERSKDHWAEYKGGKEDNHIVNHQLLEHEGGPASFKMRLIGSHRTFLSRQISQAVRIRRKGVKGISLTPKWSIIAVISHI